MPEPTLQPPSTAREIPRSCITPTTSSAMSLSAYGVVTLAGAPIAADVDPDTLNQVEKCALWYIHRS